MKKLEYNEPRVEISAMVSDMHLMIVSPSDEPDNTYYDPGKGSNPF